MAPRCVFGRPLNDFFIVHMTNGIISGLIVSDVRFTMHDFGPSVVLILKRDRYNTMANTLSRLGGRGNTVNGPCSLCKAILVPVRGAVIRSAVSVRTPSTLALSVHTGIHCSTSRLITRSSVVDDNVGGNSLYVVKTGCALGANGIARLFVVGWRTTGGNLLF